MVKNSSGILIKYTPSLWGTRSPVDFDNLFDCADYRMKNYWTGIYDLLSKKAIRYRVSN